MFNKLTWCIIDKEEHYLRRNKVKSNNRLQNNDGKNLLKEKWTTIAEIINWKREIN